MQKRSDPPRRASSWAARALGALLCLAAGGVAAHQLLRKAPIDTPVTGATPLATAPTETGRAEAARAELEEPTPFRLPARTDQNPRKADVPADSTTPWAESLDPLGSRDSARRDSDSQEPAPPGRIERSQVLTVAGSDSPDAGLPAEPPPAEPPRTEPSLPLAEIVPYADTPPEAQPLEAQPPALAAPGEVCGSITCATGFGCCNPSCGVCVAPGQNCDPTPCESRVQYPASEACGRSTCSVGQVCCNPSCGTCVGPGESCDATPCENSIQYPFSPICGRVTCSVGQECCNPSCGICVAPGETCSQQPCR